MKGHSLASNYSINLIEPQGDIGAIKKKKKKKKKKKNG